MTSNQGKSHEILAKKAGITAFYNKPLFKNDIYRAIAEHHFRMTEEHLKDFMNALE